MRVIGGTLRGRRLQAPAGQSLRPTSDRVREALFNILAPRLPDASFLDLFAGTGAVGIEAASRGCRGVVLVEQDPRHARVLQENLQACGVEAAVELLRAPVLPTLRRLDRAGRCFPVIFADPPYRAAAERRRLLRALSGAALLPAEGCLVLEGPAREPFPEEEGLVQQRLERYGDTALAFYGWPAG